MIEPVFVFGSNLAGRHGKGAALYARDHCGAIRGVGAGPMGRCYAIPTKDGTDPTVSLRDPRATLPLDVIAHHIAGFIRYATDHPGERFEVTEIGCGLAGYRPAEIAPFFRTAPANCALPQSFVDVIGARP